MNEIKAFIRPNMLDGVLRALHEHPTLPGVTVSDVRGFGRVAGRSATPEFGTIEMVKLECIVSKEQTSEVVDLIKEHARTGRPGDGKIMVSAVHTSIRIRTGNPVEADDSPE